MATHYEPGVYRGEITGHGLSKTSKDNDQFWVLFKVLGKQTGPEVWDEAEDDREATLYQVITSKDPQKTPTCIKIALATLDVLGFTGAAWDDINDDSMVGNQAWFKVSANTWNGETSDRWGLAALGGSHTKESGSALDKLFGAQLRAHRAANPVSQAERVKAKVEAAKSEETPADDIPF